MEDTNTETNDISKLSLEERVESCKNELVELEKKYALKITARLDFPVYKQLPPEVELSMSVLERNGAVFVRAFVDNQKEENHAN